ARFTVSLTGLGGFSDPVTLSITGALPAGVNAQFDQTSLSPGGQATLTLTTSGNTPGGPFTFAIRGTSGGQIHDVAGRLDVGPEWPRFHHDRRGTGQSAFRGPQVLHEAWEAYDGAAIVSSPAIGPDGTIYHGVRRYNSSIGGFLDAWNPRDGSLLWD